MGPGNQHRGPGLLQRLVRRRALSTRTARHLSAAARAAAVGPRRRRPHPPPPTARPRPPVAAAPPDPDPRPCQATTELREGLRGEQGSVVRLSLLGVLNLVL